MADSKEVLNDALNRLEEKIKAYADGKSVKEIYEDGLTRANNAGKAAKLLFDINTDSNELDRVYIEIGKLYYEENSDNPSDFYKPLFERIEEIKQSIAAKQNKVSEYRANAFKSSAQSTNPVASEEPDIIDFNEAKAEKAPDQSDT